MSQGDLFAHAEPQPSKPKLPAPPPPCFDPPAPISAARDPGTSRAAESWLRRTGEVARQARETLELLAAWQGEPPTSHELAGDDTEARYRFARRLPDLLGRGYVEHGEKRACRITGHQALTWRVTEAGRKAIEHG